MYAKELVGRMALREKPVIKKRFISSGGYGLFGSGEREVEQADYTYCDEAVKILAASDHNIVIERDGISGNSFQTILDERYCDNAWTSYDDLMGQSGQGCDNSMENGCAEVADASGDDQ